MSLGKRLKKLRKDSDKTLKEVGEKVGLSDVYISDLEKGKKINPSKEVLEKLANYYDVSIDYLLGREKEEIENPDIRAIARAGNKLSSEEAAELKSLAKRLFPNAFEEDKKES
jgi:transcriptional regulator with XRE-family HTH domain